MTYADVEKEGRTQEEHIIISWSLQEKHAGSKKNKNDSEYMLRKNRNSSHVTF